MRIKCFAEAKAPASSRIIMAFKSETALARAVKALTYVVALCRPDFNADMACGAVKDN